MNHDEHYRKIETQGVEPIVAMESVACLGLPQELTATIKRNLNLALAVKHITRCGEKDGQHANTEIAKAQNYLHRAMTGGWRPVTKADLPEEWVKHAIRAIPPKFKIGDRVQLVETGLVGIVKALSHGVSNWFYSVDINDNNRLSGYCEHELEFVEEGRGGGLPKNTVSVEPDPTVNYRNLTKVQFKDERLKSTYGIGVVIAMCDERVQVEWAEGDSLWVPQEQLELVMGK